MPMIIGADVGGTFTDVVAIEDGSLRTDKVPTSRVQSTAITNSMVTLADGTTVEALIHGTTVATNALLERKGARTVLLTDVGFEDVIEIGRQDRLSLYDPFDDRSQPLINRLDRYGMEAVEGLPDLTDVEAVAVAMIDGHKDSAREQAIRERIGSRAPAVPVSISSEVAPEFREFERVSTTALNAYLTPITAQYLKQLADDVLTAGIAEAVAVMRSSGGLISLEDAAAFPASILLSGPAGGAIATEAVMSALGKRRVISFDMGGTSTDVCRIDGGKIDVSYERSIDGYACRLPSVGIHTVGAGGGSIAWVDSGGSLRVGPRSAGALPGPASYGLGGAEPTVTDANVVLGRIGAAASFGGSVSIDAGLATDAVASVGAKLGLSPVETALGILRIAEEVMAGAARTVSIEEGSDPSGAWLVAFGGAGGLHATAVAKSLRMKGVIVPRHAGVFSALGLLLAPPRADAVAAVRIVDDDLGPASATASDLRRATTERLEAAGSEPVSIELILDVRYLGQAHEIAVPWAEADDIALVRERFEALHHQRNGFVRPDDPLETVAVRCTAVGRPPVSREALGAWAPSDPSVSSRHVVTSVGQRRKAAVVARSGLGVGEQIAGPAIIEESEATTFVDEGETAAVLADGSIEVTW
ncbi:MAG: hydantoinase/oxoprolinase family protein [Acidimicrobiia bacterium]